MQGDIGDVPHARCALPAGRPTRSALLAMELRGGGAYQRRVRPE
jgi:hypothetical protein